MKITTFSKIAALNKNMYCNQHSSVIFTPEESTYSSVSSDSCEYYQTEIFDQLPSIQASRPEQNRSEEQLEPGNQSRGPRDKASTVPLRNLAVSIQAKRDARWESLLHIPQTCFFPFYILHSYPTGRHPCCYHLKHNMIGVYAYLLHIKKKKIQEK